MRAQYPRESDKSPGPTARVGLRLREAAAAVSVGGQLAASVLVVLYRTCGVDGSYNVVVIVAPREYYGVIQCSAAVEMTPGRDRKYSLLLII
jgi:hypothetical protein